MFSSPWPKKRNSSKPILTSIHPSQPPNILLIPTIQCNTKHSSSTEHSSNGVGRIIRSPGSYWDGCVVLSADCMRGIFMLTTRASASSVSVSLVLHLSLSYCASAYLSCLSLVSVLVLPLPCRSFGSFSHLFHTTYCLKLSKQRVARRGGQFQLHPAAASTGGRETRVRIRSCRRWGQWGSAATEDVPGEAGTRGEEVS